MFKTNWKQKNKQIEDIIKKTPLSIVQSRKK